MISKTILAGLLAIAFIAGTVATQAIVYAEEHEDDGARGLIADALYSISEAIAGIEPEVIVPTDSIQVEVIGLQGETGEQGPIGNQGATGDKGETGDKAIVQDTYWVTEVNTAVGTHVGVLCDDGDKVLSGGGYSPQGLTQSSPWTLLGNEGWQIASSLADIRNEAYAVCLDSAEPYN